MVSAWACQNGVVLRQEKTDAKSYEITAIHQLLDIFELKGCMITIDAMGCQRDYVYVKLIMYLHSMVGEFFTTAIEKDFASVEHSQDEDNDYGHEQMESRICYSVLQPNYLKNFRGDWVDLISMACVLSSRDIRACLQFIPNA